MNFCYVCGKPKGTGPCEFCANGGTAREAMTAKTLEQEAREAAEKIIFQSPQPMYQTAIEMSYIAAATARDKENAELLAALDAGDAKGDAEVAEMREVIASLRARVKELEEMVPKWTKASSDECRQLCIDGWQFLPGTRAMDGRCLMVPPIPLPEGE